MGLQTHLTINRTVSRNHQDPSYKSPPDLFDAFWSIWPHHKGSKKLARERFGRLSGVQQEKCVEAARYFAAAMDGGLVDPTFQPRAENFVGGSKSFYVEWADGPPSYLKARRTRSAFGGLRDVARDLMAEEAVL